jgi:hypothetical protein
MIKNGNGKDSIIQEGTEIKGNIRPKPSTPRPSPPKGQKPQQQASKPG